MIKKYHCVYMQTCVLLRLAMWTNQSCVSPQRQVKLWETSGLNVPLHDFTIKHPHLKFSKVKTMQKKYRET